LAVVALPYLFLGMVVQGQAMLMAAGLFGIGHGVHTAVEIMKQCRVRRWRFDSSSRERQSTDVPELRRT
jgi:hypothetical protein